MVLSFSSGFADRKKSDLLVLPFWQGEKEAAAACPVEPFSAFVKLPLKSGDFMGKEGEFIVLYPREERLLLLGLGKKEECRAEGVRRAFAFVSHYCRKKKLSRISAAVPRTDFPAAAAALEGLLLAGYSFDKLKRDSIGREPPAILENICLVGIGAEAFEGCKRAASVVEAVNFARDLVNGNADDVTPKMLSETAKKLAKEYSAIKTTVLDRKKIEQEKMGLLLAVNRGSDKDPALIIAEYRGKPGSKDVTALVGKGITYDTGGLNLKPGTSMNTMKDDMAGGAAVLGAIKAAAALKIKANIVGVIASTENMIGPSSFKPGDVYISYSGKSVEIADTDAEGRLVLADAISYVEEKYAPSRIIDLATLTGGIVIALGEEAAGLFSNDDKLSEALLSAGEKCHERLWRFPLFAEYRDNLKSALADIKNTGERKATSITGAMFIRDFVKKTPWAHLDIAGTAYLSAPRRYHATPATGFGVRLLVEFLTAHAASL